MAAAKVAAQVKVGAKNSIESVARKFEIISLTAPATFSYFKTTFHVNDGLSSFIPFEAQVLETKLNFNSFSRFWNLATYVTLLMTKYELNDEPTLISSTQASLSFSLAPFYGSLVRMHSTIHDHAGRVKLAPFHIDSLDFIQSVTNGVPTYHLGKYLTVYPDVRLVLYLNYLYNTNGLRRSIERVIVARIALITGLEIPIDTDFFVSYDETAPVWRLSWTLQERIAMMQLFEAYLFFGPTGDFSTEPLLTPFLSFPDLSELYSAQELLAQFIGEISNSTLSIQADVLDYKSTTCFLGRSITSFSNDKSACLSPSWLYSREGSSSYPLNLVIGPDDLPEDRFGVSIALAGLLYPYQPANEGAYPFVRLPSVFAGLSSRLSCWEALLDFFSKQSATQSE